MNEPTTDPAVPDGDPSAAPTTDAPTTDAPTTTGPTSADAATGFGRHPVVLYTLKRIVLLLVVGGLLYLVGIRGLWLILFAFLVSGAIAMVALKDSREGAAYGITHAVQKVNDRIDASSRAEDYDDLDDDLADDGSVPASEVDPAGGEPPAPDRRP